MANRLVYIATPVHDGRVCIEHEESLLASARLCWEKGIELTGPGRVRECNGRLPGHFNPILEEARAELCDDFKATQATDIFWIDSDSGWNPEDFMRVLLSLKEFVVGVFPKKVREEDYPVFIDTDDAGCPEIDPQDGMISVSLIGLAFARLTRESILYLTDQYTVDGNCHLFERMARPGWGRPDGEDFSFCRKWTATGRKIWLVPEMDVVHTGYTQWKGNFLKFLTTQTQEEK